MREKNKDNNETMSLIQLVIESSIERLEYMLESLERQLDNVGYWIDFFQTHRLKLDEEKERRYQSKLLNQCRSMEKKLRHLRRRHATLLSNPL